MKKSALRTPNRFFAKATGFLLVILITATLSATAQYRKIIYNPCFLQDSVDQRLAFIELNAWRIFKDTASCKENLLDTITQRFITTKNAKYLQALSAIRQNPNAKVEDFYTDIISRIIENDFAGFLEQLYLARGRLAPLESEMIAALNMIVNEHPLEQKYIPLLNTEIEKAKSSKEQYKASYLVRLKQKIEAEKLR